MATGTNKRSMWYWLLLIPYIFCLWVPYYNRIDPTFDGIPFFYWYQFLWVFLASAIIGVVYWITGQDN